MSDFIDIIYEIPPEIIHDAEAELRRTEQRKNLSSVKNIGSLEAYSPEIQDIILFRLALIEFCFERCGKISNGSLKVIRNEISKKFEEDAPSNQTIVK